MFIISIIIAISLIVWIIKSRNKFVSLKEEINEQESNISNYNEQRSRSINDAMGMLGVAHQNDIEAVKRLVGESQTSELLALGQKYPDLKNTPNYTMAVTKVQQCDAEIAACKNLLNLSIKNYNKAICVFPGNLIAKLFGFNREDFVDQSNMSNNRTVNTEEVDLNSYKI